MATIAETLDRVASSARTHKNPKPRVVSKEETLPYGTTIRQGDVMLTRWPVTKKFPDLTPFTNVNSAGQAQLAPGDTVGSRHIIRQTEGVKVFARKGADVLHGPIVVAPNGFYLEHPVHACVDCQLPGVYEVTYPRDLGAEGLQRRRD